ncbi:hypothetical protein HZ326_24155 [Fusarium oxysporum f. sp. albedinis]|nr:hypothetical protein HZ326_24155 [Fusarium oxysporum f. sp. albedinis]
MWKVIMAMFLAMHYPVASKATKPDMTNKPGGSRALWDLISRQLNKGQAVTAMANCASLIVERPPPMQLTFSISCSRDSR